MPTFLTETLEKLENDIKAHALVSVSLSVCCS